MRGFVFGLAAGALVMGWPSASANAAQDKSSSKPRSSTTAPDLLAGPKVEPEATQQRNNPGRPNANAGEKTREMEIPMQQWIGALRGLGLSQDQQEKGRAIAAEFQQAMREFQDEHGEEMRKLFGEVREARQNGTEPPREAREKMKRFEDARPKPDPYKERIWALLNEQQQTQMKDKLDAMKKEMMERRGDRKDSKREPAGTNPKDAAAKPGEMNDASGSPPTGDEMMAPPVKKSDQSGPADNPAREGKPNPKRTAGNWSGATALNAVARRRLEFLQAHQSLHRAGWAPREEQRKFDFGDADQSTKKD